MKSRLNKYSNLTQRVIVALIGVAVIISAIYWQAWSYFAIFLMISFLSLREFYKLVGLGGYIPLAFWGTLSGMLIYTFTFLVQMHLVSNAVFYMIFPFTAIIYFIKLYKKSDVKPFTNIAYTFLGILYVAVPFSLLHIIAFCTGEYRFELVTGILLLTWASDTGGYFAGTLFGKTKLFLRISPKKSWEGFVGGALLTLLIAYLISGYVDILPLWKWMTIGILTVIAGTYGDLIESLFKRSINIKDSGESLPGHGGFLDRFDALLLSLPFIAAFLKLF
ncbi:MAG: phosphatidate cytidylyltransferase [Cyclobacteriaceae bacterium]|nr:phosphatidate cytidylyltransferase [Cyclobacteriaceae bacterium]